MEIESSKKEHLRNKIVAMLSKLIEQKIIVSWTLQQPNGRAKKYCQLFPFCTYVLIDFFGNEYWLDPILFEGIPSLVLADRRLKIKSILKIGTDLSGFAEAEMIVSNTIKG